MVRIPGEVVVRLAIAANEVTQRVMEVAVSSGLALMAVGTGHLLLDSAHPNLGDEIRETPKVHHKHAA